MTRKKKSFFEKVTANWKTDLMLFFGFVLIVLTVQLFNISDNNFTIENYRTQSFIISLPPFLLAIPAIVWVVLIIRNVQRSRINLTKNIIALLAVSLLCIVLLYQGMINLSGMFDTPETIIGDCTQRKSTTYRVGFGLYLEVDGIRYKTDGSEWVELDNLAPVCQVNSKNCPCLSNVKVIVLPKSKRVIELEIVN